MTFIIKKGLATQLLFDPQIGIIKFLNDTSRVTDPVLAKAKIALLEFLFLYIRKIKSDIEPYAESIKVYILYVIVKILIYN